MRIPGFSAEATLGPSVGHYAGVAGGTAGPTGGLSPALVAPPVCKTSGCITVGRCRTRVRCCRNFTGACTCKTTPCFIF